jgi:hypothetical protein
MLSGRGRQDYRATRNGRKRWAVRTFADQYIHIKFMNQRGKELTNGSEQKYERDFGPLTQRQAENIADLASERAEERMYAKLGRSVVKKTLYLLGAGAAFAATWASDLIHFGPK